MARSRQPTLLKALVFMLIACCRPDSFATAFDLTPANVGLLSRPQAAHLPVQLATADSADHSNHARQLLQAGSNATDCVISEWACAGCHNIAPSLFDTISTANCTEVTGLDLWLCGQALVATEVVNAVKAGQCEKVCQHVIQTRPCLGPVPAPAPAPARIAAMAPAPPPVPASPSPIAAASPSLTATPTASPLPVAAASPPATATPPAASVSPRVASPTAPTSPPPTATPLATPLPSPAPPADASTPCDRANATWACTYNNCTQHASPDLFDMIYTGNVSCTPFGNQVICGSHFMDQDLYNAITLGSCKLTCNDKSLPCASAPAPAPAAAKPRAPAPGPSTSKASPPAPSPPVCPPTNPCPNPEFECGANNQYRMSEILYYTAKAASQCVPDLDPTFCIASEFIMEQPVWAAIKANNCTSVCLNHKDHSTAPSCPAPPPLPTPKATSPALPPPNTAPPTIAPKPAPLATAMAGAGAYGAAAPAGGYGQPVGSLSLRPVTTPQADYVLNFGEFGDCSKDCGGGTAERLLTCISRAYGFPVALSLCQHNMSDIASLSKPCNTAKCSGYYWTYGPWSACSATCGSSGTATRNATCMYDGKPVPSNSADYTAQCLPLGLPPTVQECFATPCSSYMWTVSAWSACTAGRATRSVTCTRAQGGTADDSVCATNTGYTPASNRLCDVFSCQADSDCSGNGVCEKNTGTCLCKPDFQGEACNIATAHCNATTAATNATAAPATTSTLCCASGVVDKKGSCCASGVVDNTGACCGDKASLDRNGQCCSQKLDACGMCGGDGLIIDFVGTCCNGVIDAGGLCCAKPHVVDEFGVCGGNSSTGILVLDIDVVTDVTQGLSDHNSANYAAFEKAYTTVLATIINVPAGQVQLKTIYATSSTGRRLLDVSTAEDALVGGWRKQLRHWMLHSPRHTTAKAVTTLPASAASHLLVQPTTDRRLLASGASSTLVTVQTTAQIRPPYPTDVPFPEVLEVMLGIYSNTPEHGAIGIKELADINKIGLAGNSICEVGEMPNGTTAGVSSDCPLAFHPVPIKGSKFCSGKGTPVAALGTCQCFVGYDGTACESCAEGYALMAGTCQRTYAGFLAEAKALAAAAAAPSPAKHVAGASVTLPVTAAVVGAVALLVALALFTTYHRRRQARRAGSAASDATKAGAQRTGSAGSAMSGLAWAFADPERGSSATSGTSSLTTPGAAGRSGTALLVDGESSPAPSRRGNFKMVLLNSKPLGHIAKWLTANGITEDQVEVQQAPARSSSQTSSEGSLAPSDTSVYQHFKKVYNNFAMETGEIPTPPPATRPEYAMEKMDSIVGKPGYGFQVAASADKSAAARRGSMAFSQGSDDGSDAGLVAAKPARRGLFGFSLGTSEPMAATTAAAARDPSMAFSDASSEGKVPRAMLGSVAFASEEAAAVRQARRASLAFSSASSDDSQTSAGRKQMGSIAFADSAAAKAKAPQLGSFAFSEGEARKGGRAGQMGSFAFSDDDATSKGKTPARLGSFAFSNASSDDERRSAKRHGFNYALDEEGRRAARPSGVAMEALPEGGVQRAESTMSTDTIKSKRSYAYKMDVVEQRKRYATFSTVDASDSSITSASSGDGNLTARPNALFSSFVSTSEASTSSHTSGSVAPSDPSSNGSGRALISSKAPPKKPASWRRDNNIKEDKPLPPPAPSS